jgi:uncharacterized membrane protein
MNQEQPESGQIDTIANKFIPAYLLLNRYTLALFNLLLVTIIVFALWDLVKLLLSTEKDMEEMVTIMSGIGAIMVSYGIVLEERESLMQIFKCYPKYQNEKEAAVDEIAHDGGIVLLVLGLFVEITAQFVEIPDRIINTDGLETVIFVIGCILLAITILHFVNFCYKLLTAKPNNTTKS